MLGTARERRSCDLGDVREEVRLREVLGKGARGSMLFVLLVKLVQVLDAFFGVKRERYRYSQSDEDACRLSRRWRTPDPSRACRR